jgi:predicted amidophosphoribosyltransferase
MKKWKDSFSSTYHLVIMAIYCPIDILPRLWCNTCWNKEILAREVLTIMALRKENFHDEDKQQEANTMKRSRITIDISPELRRRIKVAASQRDLSISEYLGRILEENVPDEVSIKQRQRKPLTRETLEHVYQVREEIMDHTNRRIFEDSTEIIRQMREERSQELDQL